MMPTAPLHVGQMEPGKWERGHAQSDRGVSLSMGELEVKSTSASLPRGFPLVAWLPEPAPAPRVSSPLLADAVSHVLLDFAFSSANGSRAVMLLPLSLCSLTFRW